MSRTRAVVPATLAAAALVLLGASRAVGSSESANRGTAICANGGASAGVGKITKIFHTKVFVNLPEVTSAPSPLRAKQYLCTDGTGNVKFELTKLKKTVCSTRPRSRLRLYPAAGTVISFVAGPLTPQGVSWCATNGGSSVKYGASTGNTKLYTNDPVFGVQVTRKESIAKVTYGFFAVYTLAGKEPVLLGPLEQASVSPTGVVRGPEPLVLTDEDRSAIDQLGPPPKPNFARPAAGGSNVLTRIFSRGAIRVGFDPARASSRTRVFVKRYFTFLARRWNVRFVSVPTDSAQALADGTVDVVATPRRQPSGVEVQTLPFLTDEKANAWDLELLPEADLVAGMRGYLVTSLESTDYAGHYRAAFGSPPSYVRFTPVIFPTLPPP